MASITDLGNAAWRDWVTDGAPSSGARHAPKSDARAVMAAIDAQKAEGVADLAALKALSTRPLVVLVRTGRAAGMWQWHAGATSSGAGYVDTLEAAPTSGTAGLYKRVYGSYIDGSWFVSDLANARAGLNYALAIAATTTRCVIVPKAASDYTIDSQLTQPSGVALIGVGWPVIKLKSNCSPLPNAMITGDGASGSRASNLLLQGIVFDGNRENNINHGTPDGSGNQAQGWEGLPLVCVSFAFSDNVKVRNLQIKNMWASGIWLVDCTDEEITGCRVTEYRKSGISVRRYLPTESPGATTARITNNYTAGGTVGIHCIFGTTRVIAAGNHCESNRDSAAYPAFAWDGTYPNVWPKGDGQDWTQYGEGGYVSPVNDGDGAGIELTGYHTVVGAAREKYVTIVANICYANQAGIRAEQEANGVTVTGNICCENDKYGVFIYSSTDILVSANQINRNGENGVSVQKATSQAVSTYIQILDNQITRNDLFGVSLENATNVEIADNFLADNRQDSGGTGGAIGLFRDGTDACSDIDIYDNKIIQTGGYWLYYDNAAHSAKFVDNACSGTPTAKMNNVNRTNTIIRGNEGILTRSRGTSNVLQNSFVSVAHGLDFTPNVSDIRIIPVEDLQADGRLYVSPTPGSNTFDVLMAGGPADLDFAWSIDDH